MNSNPKLTKRAFSFIMALALVLSMVLVPGVFSVNVAAVEGEETTKELTYYVAGTAGSDENDGRSADAPLATVKAAYDKFASIADDNTVIYIVICGEVHLSGCLDSKTDSSTGSTAWYINKKYKGTVVFTSKDKENDYRGDSVGFYLDNASWDLWGNTTFEHIDIRDDAANIIANYYSLILGEGVGVYATGNWRLAGAVILGHLGNTFHNNVDATLAKDIIFTMKSGKIDRLTATGINNQGYKNNYGGKYGYVPYNVTLNLEGGTLEHVTLMSNPTNAPVNNISVNISGTAKVTSSVALKNEKNTEIQGAVSCVLDLKGKTVTMTVADDLALDIIDTANNKKGGTGAGTFKNTGSGTVNTIAQDPATKMRYLKVDNGDGTVSAHPFNLTITKYGINPNATDGAAIAFNAAFMANNVALENIENWGIAVKEDGEEVFYSAKEYAFNENNFVRVRVNLLNSLSKERIGVAKTVRACVILKTGEKVYSTAQTELKPYDVLMDIAENVNSGDLYATDEEKTIINDLVEQVKNYQ